MDGKVERCPFCGNFEFVEGRHEGYGAISGEGILTSTPLYHQICRRCGSVVRSYVKDPELLLKRKNRKDNF